MQVDGAHVLMISVAPDATGTTTRMLRGFQIVIIWLLRHGDAEDSAEDDDARRLTEKGVRQAKAAGGALAALEVSIDACLTSPKVRARDMARIACDQLAVEVEEVELATGRGDVLLVGHEPDFSRAIQASTGARVQLKKGALAAIQDGTLIALLGPAQLGAIAACQ
jgi:phosphohistidine phosphatase